MDCLWHPHKFLQRHFRKWVIIERTRLGSLCILSLWGSLWILPRCCVPWQHQQIYSATYETISLSATWTNFLNAIWHCSYTYQGSEDLLEGLEIWSRPSESELILACWRNAAWLILEEGGKGLKDDIGPTCLGRELESSIWRSW